MSDELLKEMEELSSKLEEKINKTNCLNAKSLKEELELSKVMTRVFSKELQNAPNIQNMTQDIMNDIRKLLGQ